MSDHAKMIRSLVFIIRDVSMNKLSRLWVYIHAVLVEGKDFLYCGLEWWSYITLRIVRQPILSQVYVFTNSTLADRKRRSIPVLCENLQTQLGGCW
jgi:hypothetical protein